MNFVESEDKNVDSEAGVDDDEEDDDDDFVVEEEEKEDNADCEDEDGNSGPLVDLELLLSPLKSCGCLVVMSLAFTDTINTKSSTPTGHKHPLKHRQRPAILAIEGLRKRSKI